ncbi:hypothetical protein N7474_001301 [Penicillium riverlandense]|uniref:uncharacterized protein n=1 Tax=Penicillium riverlandense TaxID=1903569 RepID=UPI0025478DB1|nr:uncharacterized protein N7474_001301 [Penicillium riverlandense]KAJ5832990.1 hypothetical protein N7474_001301 [Penicillium riverlandense]
MYYMLYLASLCRRRRWPEPTYESSGNEGGYSCVVRVNNREYQTDAICESEVRARESAAMRAYLICRNFSVNDGMYPAGHSQGGAVQGIPVAIGTGRKSSRDDDTDTSVSSSGGSSSGGSSPENRERIVRLGGAGGHHQISLKGGVDVTVPTSARALTYGGHGA